MNKFGVYSILMVLLSILTFFILKGPDADLTIGVFVFGILSLLGILFAVMSKKWLAGIIGVLSNGVVFVFALLLLLAKGIGG